MASAGDPAVVAVRGSGGANLRRIVPLPHGGHRTPQATREVNDEVPP